ncbi:MAG: hypothetical protein KDC10_06920 [Calditrichaeota bacterium]|nr:hypothetical protein [Calditrichota bacterium]
MKNLLIAITVLLSTFAAIAGRGPTVELKRDLPYVPEMSHTGLSLHEKALACVLSYARAGIGDSSPDTGTGASAEGDSLLFEELRRTRPGARRQLDLPALDAILEFHLERIEFNEHIQDYRMTRDTPFRMLHDALLMDRPCVLSISDDRCYIVTGMILGRPWGNEAYPPSATQLLLVNVGSCAEKGRHEVVEKDMHRLRNALIDANLDAGRRLRKESGAGRLRPMDQDYAFLHLDLVARPRDTRPDCPDCVAGFRTTRIPARSEQVVCTHCGGLGAQTATSCVFCSGTGTIVTVVDLGDSGIYGLPFGQLQDVSQDPCPACGATGHVNGCQVCKGSGWRLIEEAERMERHRCPTCKGEGRISTEGGG